MLLASKPTPSSSTTTSSVPRAASMLTVTRCAEACFVTFDSASWTTR